jgi:hypothetical protein
MIYNFFPQYRGRCIRATKDCIVRSKKTPVAVWVYFRIVLFNGQTLSNSQICRGAGRHVDDMIPKLIVEDTGGWIRIPPRVVIDDHQRKLETNGIYTRDVYHTDLGQLECENMYRPSVTERPLRTKTGVTGA